MEKLVFLSTSLPLSNNRIDDFLSRQQRYFQFYWGVEEVGCIQFVSLNGEIVLEKHRGKNSFTRQISQGKLRALKSLFISSPRSLFSSQSPGFDGVLALFLGKLFKVPVIIQVHFDPMSTVFSRYRRILHQFVLNRAQSVRSVTDISISGMNFGFRNFEIIPVPFDLPDQIQSSEKFEKNVDLIFFGRMHREKGVKFLVELLEHFKESSHIRIVCVGDGPLGHLLRDYLHQQPRNVDLQLIKWLDRQSLFSLLLRSKLHINVSPSESYGLSFIEAAFCGVPTLATPTVGAKNLASFIPSLKVVNTFSVDDFYCELNNLLLNEKELHLLSNLVPDREFLISSFSDFTSWPNFIKKVIKEDKKCSEVPFNE